MKINSNNNETANGKYNNLSGHDSIKESQSNISFRNFLNRDNLFDKTEDSRHQSKHSDNQQLDNSLDEQPLSHIYSRDIFEQRKIEMIPENSGANLNSIINEMVSNIQLAKDNMGRFWLGIGVNTIKLKNSRIQIFSDRGKIKIKFIVKENQSVEWLNSVSDILKERLIKSGTQLDTIEIVKDNS